MVVLDLVARDPRVTQVTLIEPDIYKPHNVERHYFGPEAVGDSKAAAAKAWLQERRPNLVVRTLVCDLLDSAHQDEIERAVAVADLGVCAVDNEPAKYHWDELMRRRRKPWTLGEVLSGGIGGFIHWFVPDGPCYGCVASHLKRALEVEKPQSPDYSQPGGAIEEATIPASKAAIHAIAALHAVLTLQLLEADSSSFDPGFTSLLLTLQRVADVFAEPFRAHRLRIGRAADCLICQPQPVASPAEDLDVALAQALARLGEPDHA
jgi:molybdopterin/thiamine biosynthesis adenylyltransferase